MSSLTAGQGSSVSQHLRATKKILRGVIFDAGIAANFDTTEVDILERDAFEVLRLIRSWRNRLAPVNKIPPEILGLIPDFLDLQGRNQDVITLTHVCRAWREVFISWSSLWTDFDCVDGEQTRIYLERSKSSPIDLSLKRSTGIFPDDPLFQIIPHATGRLKSLSIRGTPEDIEAITSHLSHPAPLLEYLSIYAGYRDLSDHHPALTSALFRGDFSSLRILHLGFARTELPWRNMVNLTSFRLAHTPPGAVTAGQLLDFFESAPHLREVTLTFATPTAGAQNGRLVSMACLKSMYIDGSSPSSVLLDHLLIPVGAELKTRAVLFSSLVGEHLPKSLDNLKNFSDFTTVRLCLGEYYPRVEFSGPNGQVITVPRTSQDDRTGLALGSLIGLDTSKTEQLEIDHGNGLSRDPFYQALLSTINLRTLMLFRCTRLHTFIEALDPRMDLSGVVVCPKLEELVVTIHVHGEIFDIKSIIEMAAARASRGEEIRTIRIIDGRDKADVDVSELRRYVWNVEYVPGVGL